MTTVQFPGITRLDLPVDRILTGASDAELDSVVVVGFRADGGLHFASSCADGGNAAWLLTRALHQLHQQADTLKDVDLPAKPETSSEVVPMRVAGLLLNKPRAPLVNDANGANLWGPDCTGRLVLGTGCGACLRCNREWWALVRNSHERVSADVIRLSERDVVEALGRAPVQVPPLTAAVQADPIHLTAAQALLDHVDAWNTASAVGDAHRMRTLDVELRSLAFPPGVQVVIVGDDAPGSPKRKVIIHAPAQPQA